MTRQKRPGDLIEFFRTGYRHWGVYVGDDEVVHLTIADGMDSCSSGGKAVVKLENIWKVAGGCFFKVNNLFDFRKMPRDPDVIVMEAYEMVGEKFHYSVTEANCEHFATQLRYGKPMSLQAIKAIIAIGAGAASVPVVGPPLFTAALVYAAYSLLKKS